MQYIIHIYTFEFITGKVYKTLSGSWYYISIHSKIALLRSNTRSIGRC